MSAYDAEGRFVPKVRRLWSPAVAEAVRQWHLARLAAGPRPNSRRKRRDRACYEADCAQHEAEMQAVYGDEFLGGETPLGAED